MSEHELFERILGSLHEAALDDALWPATSHLIDEACGSKGNFLVFGTEVSPDDIDIFSAWLHYRGQSCDELVREYFETYHARDERLPRIRRLPDSQVVHVSSLYTDEELKTSRAYNEALLKGQMQNGLNVRLDGPDGSRIIWGTGDPVDGDGWSTARVETIERLLPHLRRFVRFRQALVDARALGSSLTALLEQYQSRRHLARPAGMHRRGERPRRATSCAGVTMGWRIGTVFCAPPSQTDDARLQSMLARVFPPFGGRGAGGSITLKRSVVSPRLVLHAVPLEDKRMDGRPSGVAALVLVVDPASRGRIDPALVGAMLGLTPAESQVAAMLAQGYTIRNIATATGRGEGTIRWHTKQIFGKLGISRQIELVQLVLSLSDIPHTQR